MQEIALVSDIPGDRGLGVKVDGKNLALFKVGRRVYAVENSCPHAGAFLDQSYKEGRVIRCPMHGWDFDLKTGESPTFVGICVQTFPVRVRRGKVYLASA
jgi:3-phenylpropionate/trans-cinnamate dioxygenase ferredoxin subunit